MRPAARPARRGAADSDPGRSLNWHATQAAAVSLPVSDRGRDTELADGLASDGRKQSHKKSYYLFLIIKKQFC